MTGSLEVWDVRQGRKTNTIQFDESVLTCTFSPRGDFLLVGAGDIYVCHPTTGRIIKRLAFAPYCKAMAVSPDGKFVALATQDGVQIRDLKSWHLKKRIVMHSPRAAFINTMIFSPDGRCLLTGARDVPDGMEVFDITSRHRMWGTDVDGDPEENVAWAPDSTRVAATVADSVVLFSARDGRILKKFPTDYDSPVMFSPDSRQLVFANSSTLVTYDVPTGKITGKIGIKYFSSYTISPDARLLAHLSPKDCQVHFRKVN